MQEKDISEDFSAIAKGAGIVFLGMLASKVLTYAWRLIVARFGPEAYGLISLGIALLTIVTTLSMFGFANGVERFVAYYYGKNKPKKMENALSLGLGVSLVATSVLAVMGFIFADTLAESFFGKPELGVIIRILSLALPASAFIEIYAAAFRGIQKVKYTVIGRNALDSVYKIMLALVPMALGAGIAGLSAGYVTALYLTAITLALYMKRRNIHVLKIPLWDKELVSYSLPLLAASLITTSMPYIDTIVLGVFRSASEVGVYNAAFPAAQLLLIAPTAIFSLFLSVATANFAKKNMAGVRQLYQQVSKWVFLANLPVLVFLVFFSEKTLYYFFGPEYSSASTSLAVLAVGNFIFSFFWSSLFIHSTMKKTRELVQYPTAALITNVVLNMALIPAYGIIGASVATTIAMLVYGGLFFANTHKLLGVFPLDRKTITASVATITVLGAWYLIASVLHMRFLEASAGFAILTVLYAVSLFYFNVLGTFERSLVNSIWNKLKQSLKQ